MQLGRLMPDGNATDWVDIPSKLYGGAAGFLGSLMVMRKYTPGPILPTFPTTYKGQGGQLTTLPIT